MKGGRSRRSWVAHMLTVLLRMLVVLLFILCAAIETTSNTLAQDIQKIGDKTVIYKGPEAFRCFYISSSGVVLETTSLLKNSGFEYKVGETRTYESSTATVGGTMTCRGRTKAIWTGSVLVLTGSHACRFDKVTPLKLRPFPQRTIEFRGDECVIVFAGQRMANCTIASGNQLSTCQ